MTTTTIKLDHPIAVDGVEVTELTLRRPKVRDVRAADKSSGSDGAREIRLFANLCEQTPAAMEELDMADYLKIQEAYQDFLSPKKT